MFLFITEGTQAQGKMAHPVYAPRPACSLRLWEWELLGVWVHWFLFESLIHQACKLHKRYLWFCGENEAVDSADRGFFLFSLDVDSLYTNIETLLGLKAVGDCFNKYPDASRPNEAILELLV